MAETGTAGAKAAGRRATDRARTLWQEARHSTGLPRLADLDLRDDAARHGNEMILRCDRDVMRSVLVACGPAAQAGLGQPRLGATLEDTLPAPISREIAAACRRALALHRPVEVEGRFEPPAGGEPVMFRSVFMPVLAGNEQAAYLFGAFSCKQSTGPGPA
ncbi:MAG TPA: hypothetical protein VE631_08475 [Alphaproteobacteria bacterium]|jgi:hypothetical protein|nr:hypothetical protein [Alphaproteobacteria bacterium]